MKTEVFDPRELRNALGHFATGVTIVTTRTEDGEPIGMTASSFNTVSLDPPLVLWSVGKRAFGYSAFEDAGHFAIHVLNRSQKELSNRFGSASFDKFADLAVQQGLHDLPLLEDCAACFECRVEHRSDGGDHLILVGRVLPLQTDAEAREPLLFYRGQYAELAVG